MTVLVVCDVYGNESNGTVIAAKNLINSLRKDGHRVKILCTNPAFKNEKDFYVAPNLKLPKFLQNYVNKNDVTLGYGNKKVALEALKDVDVVHIMQPLALGNYMAKFAHKRGYKITAGFHTQAENVSNHFFLMNNKQVNRYFYKYFWKSLYRYCDAIHYPTQFIRDLFEKAIKRKTNGFVISNGISPTFIDSKRLEKDECFKDKYLIAFSGRLSKEKNQMMLIKAVELSKYKDNIQIVLAGSGPLLSNLMNEGQNLPNPPIIKLYTRDELSKLLCSIDLYVHTALIDLESISCLEAIASGALPLLSDSPRAAVKEYSRDEYCVFKYDSPTDLKDHIEWFIEHPKESEEIREKYKDFANKYHLDECMKQMNKMLEYVNNLPSHKENIK